MGKIRFQFDVNKFVCALAYLADNVLELSTLKAAKLLYLADREHLLKHGRPILGDWYSCMDNGPVPSRAYDLMKSIRDQDSSVQASGSGTVKKYLEVRGRSPHPVFKKRPNTQVPESLSLTDRDALEETVRQYGSMNVYDLVEITHEHKAWKKCRENKEHVIPYEDFFEDDPSQTALLEIMRLDQENRDVVDFLRTGR